MDGDRCIKKKSGKGSLWHKQSSRNQMINCRGPESTYRGFGSHKTAGSRMNPLVIISPTDIRSNRTFETSVQPNWIKSAKPVGASEFPNGREESGRIVLGFATALPAER